MVRITLSGDSSNVYSSVIQSAVYSCGILTSSLNAGIGTTNLLYGATLACLTKTGSWQGAMREGVKMEIALLLSIAIEPKAAGASLVKTSCFFNSPTRGSRDRLNSNSRISDSTWTGDCHCCQVCLVWSLLKCEALVTSDRSRTEELQWTKCYFDIHAISRKTQFKF